MKSRELALLLRHPLLQLDGFVLKGALLFKPPVDRLLRGIYFDSSGFDRRAFYPTLFVMPTCVPTSNLNFNFGDRIRMAAGGERWNTEMPDLVIELGAALKRATIFLSGIDSHSAFVNFAQSGLRTERTLEGIGYALACDGKISQAIAVFNELLDKIDVRVHWHVELADRINDLKRTLIESPEIARGQLALSETETIRNLGLTKFRGA